MRLKKILIILLMPMIAEVIIACCDCLESVIKNYSNKSMSVENIDNSGPKPVVTLSSSVRKNAYGIKASFQRELIACSENPAMTFVPSAYAFSCGCAPDLLIMPKDSIIDIKVFSIYDFDSSHQAGSNVSDYFKVNNGYSFLSITDYLKPQMEYYSLYSNLVLYDETELESEILLLLMTNPKVRTGNKFKIEISLSDGRVFQQETTEIDFI